MSEHHPTAPAETVKPAKPYPEFPLFPHATRRWAKKIRGQLHYFGPWDDPDAALKKYLEQKDALHAGRKPREATEGVTIKDLCNQFLNAKRALVESGELTNRSWQDYKAAGDLIVSHFGKGRLVADLMFITKYGLPWAKDTADQTLAKEFGKLLRALHINGRTGLGFYALRHTFRTVADESKDQPAVDHIMGHEVPHMSSVYRETITDARLKAVTDHVRCWLFPPKRERPESTEAEAATEVAGGDRAGAE
jgi:hypothetical protein